MLTQFNETFNYSINYDYLHERTDEMVHNGDDYDLWREHSMEQKFEREAEDRYIYSIFETLTTN